MLTQTSRALPLDRMGVDPGLPVSDIACFFDHLPDAAFSTKDSRLRFTAANAAMLELCGVARGADIIGRTACDFFAKACADRYEEAERRVLLTGRSGMVQLDRCETMQAVTAWLLIRRWPMISDHNVTGVVTLARNLDNAEQKRPVYSRLLAALGYIEAHVGLSFDYSAMAASAGASLSQLQRDFVNVIGLSPRDYVTQLRFESALDMLGERRPIAEIAHACGYSDQSAFTRRFRSATGMSPMQYRRSYEMRRQRPRLVSA